jgi:hypothetical protein
MHAWVYTRMMLVPDPDVCMYVCMYACICVYINACIYSQAEKTEENKGNPAANALIVCMYVYICIYILMHTRRLKKLRRKKGKSFVNDLVMCMYVYICIYTYTHAYSQAEETEKKKGQASVNDLDLEGKIAAAMAAKLKYYADRAYAVS